MARVPVPMDLSRIKPKVFLNLTLRQIICVGSGALIGVPLFLLLKDRINQTLATMLMVIVMLPFFMLAMFEKNGEPLEKVLSHVYQARFVRPRVRPYQTNNLYTALMRHINTEKEVKRIVQKAKARSEVHAGGEEADRSASGEGEE